MVPNVTASRVINILPSAHTFTCLDTTSKTCLKKATFRVVYDDNGELLFVLGETLTEIALPAAEHFPDHCVNGISTVSN